MKVFIRTYLIVFLSIFLAQALVGGLSYGGILSSSYVLFILALTLVHFFVFPLLKVLSLPTKGLGGLFLKTLLAGLVLYLSTSAIQGFNVTSTFLPAVSFSGITLPSKNLTPFEALIALSLTYSIISSLLIWLCKGKK